MSLVTVRPNEAVDQRLLDEITLNSVLESIVKAPCSATRLKQREVKLLRDYAEKCIPIIGIHYTSVGRQSVTCAQKVTVKVDGGDFHLRGELINPSAHNEKLLYWEGFKVLVVYRDRVRTAFAIIDDKYHILVPVI